MAHRPLHVAAIRLAGLTWGGGAVAAEPPAASKAAHDVLDRFALAESLASCRAETQRNAKLYALRAHGIRLMRSAERSQSRSAQALDVVFAHLRSGLSQNKALLAEVYLAEDAAMSLTELTVQEPVASQIRAAELMADQADQACSKILAETGAAATGNVQASLVAALSQLQFLSQRIARVYLAAPLTGTLDASQQALLQADSAAFEKGLAALRAPASTDPGLKEHLLFVDSQWIFYRTILARPRGTLEGLDHVGRVSEHLFELFTIELTRRRIRT